MLLAKRVGDLVLIEKVPHINAHADTIEPRPHVWMRHNLLLGITVSIIDDVLRFVCTRNGESSLNKSLGPNEIERD